MRTLRRGGRRPVLVTGEEGGVMEEAEGERLAMGEGLCVRCRSVACIALSLGVNCNDEEGEGEGGPSFGGVHTTLTLCDCACSAAADLEVWVYVPRCCCCCCLTRQLKQMYALPVLEIS